MVGEPSNFRAHRRLHGYLAADRGSHVVAAWQKFLKNARFSSETVYFTDTFDSLDAAKEILTLCIKRGFNDAEIEVVYE